jgi:hypothetical protein
MKFIEVEGGKKVKLVEIKYETGTM